MKYSEYSITFPRYISCYIAENRLPLSQCILYKVYILYCRDDFLSNQLKIDVVNHPIGGKFFLVYTVHIL